MHEDISMISELRMIFSIRSLEVNIRSLRHEDFKEEEQDKDKTMWEAR